MTGREVVVLFEGHYHGHLEEGLVDLEGGHEAPIQRGLSKSVTGRTRIAQFNDPDTLAAVLAPDDVAIVLTEPALTNMIHFLPPAAGWHAELRRLTREHGTLLALDETHTHVIGEHGATGLWELEPDIVTIGKAVAGGIPMGAYGVTTALAPELDVERDLATGGTLFGNALSMAAARAALGEVLTPAAYAQTSALGARLAEGITWAHRRGRPPVDHLSVRPQSRSVVRTRAADGRRSVAPGRRRDSRGSSASGWPTGGSGRRSPVPDRPSRSRRSRPMSTATSTPTPSCSARSRREGYSPT